MAAVAVRETMTDRRSTDRIDSTVQSKLGPIYSAVPLAVLTLPDGSKILDEKCGPASNGGLVCIGDAREKSPPRSMKGHLQRTCGGLISDSSSC
ncbi:hypothetical protein BaRGS_00008688 [Batillaria attramentaria]|uniref:Uncharacterized protein n=1 Tax=Batillaria attramentaria TaxID=370345 RepID=A0ABD0LKS0_9CAEN